MVEYGEPKQAPEGGNGMSVLPFGETFTGIESERMGDLMLAQSSSFAMLAK
jgi:hypothetical protein